MVSSPSCPVCHSRDPQQRLHHRQGCHCLPLELCHIHQMPNFDFSRGTFLMLQSSDWRSRSVLISRGFPGYLRRDDELLGYPGNNCCPMSRPGRDKQCKHPVHPFPFCLSSRQGGLQGFYNLRDGGCESLCSGTLRCHMQVTIAQGKL